MKAIIAFRDAGLEFFNRRLETVPITQLTQFDVELKTFCYIIANTEISARRLQEFIRTPTRKPAYLMRAMLELRKELPEVAIPVVVQYTHFGRYYG